MEQILKPDMDPLQWAIETISDMVRVFGCRTVAELRYVDYEMALICLHAGIKVHMPNPGTVYYEVDSLTARNLSIRAMSNKNAFQIVRTICAHNVWNGKEVPTPFRPIAQALLLGTDRWSWKPGARPNKEFFVRYLAVSAVENLNLLYGIDKRRGDGSPHHSCADIVVEALAQHGYHTTFNTVASWVSSKTLRCLTEPLDEYFAEETLVSLKLIKRRQRFELNPWGQFAPMDIMTLVDLADNFWDIQTKGEPRCSISHLNKSVSQLAVAAVRPF